MECLAGGRGADCTRWLVLAGMLASAVAAFMLLRRLADDGPSLSDGPEDVYGM